MSINEKNKNLVSTAQSSQWKIVPRPDESDEIRGIQNPAFRENCQIEQDWPHRSLRDATAFYRNDTSHFLGELQKAESLLYQKVNLVSKIDFLPSKRKTSPQKDRPKTQDRGFDEQLSDTDSVIVTVPRIKRNKHKNDEPEKLIVDVNDFIDTFSVLREPVFHRATLKKPSDHGTITEYDLLLNRISLKQENDKGCETFDNVVLPVNSNESNPAASERHFTEPSTTSQDVLHFADDPIVIHDTIHHQTSFAIATVEDVYPCHSDIPHTISENNREQEPVVLQNEAKVCEEHVVPEKSTATVENQACDVTKKEIDGAANLSDTNRGKSPDVVLSGCMADDMIDVAENETSSPFVVQLPGILERLGEFAGDQCDSLADYIKDKVYDGSRLIAFCGMKRGVGCSTMTLLAARGITRHGLKTAVIDANFEFPELCAKVTGQWQNEESWVNILHGSATWEELGITPQDMPMLTVFPLAENALVTWSRYEPERLQQETNRFVSTLQESFDLILLDCGCFEDPFEEITWGELALFQPDGVILVRNPKETPLEMIEPCCHEILNGGIGAFGVAENFV